MKIIIHRDRIQDLIISLQSALEKDGEELVIYDNFWKDEPMSQFVYFDYSEDNKAKIEFVKDNYKPTTKIGVDLKDVMLKILGEKTND